MNKILIFFVLLAAGLYFAGHNSKLNSGKSKSAVAVASHATDENSHEAVGSEIQRRQVAAIPETFAKSLATQRIKAPTFDRVQSVVKPAHAGQGSLPRESSSLPTQVSPKNQNLPYDKNDEQLLRQLLSRAQTEGSRIAYIGGVSALMAFDSHFIQKYQTADGRIDYRAQKVESTQSLSTPQGSVSMSVQRIPYPLPPGSEANYELLNRGVMKATDDGAMVINLATPNLDRSRLQDSIQYARSRGAVVVTVNKKAI